MGKKFTLLFFIILFAISYIFDIQKDIKNKALDINYDIQVYYTQKLINFEKLYIRYFSQANTIEKLQKQILISKMNAIPIIQLENELKSLKNFNENILPNNEVKTTRILHLKNISDYTQIWIDLEKSSSSINGLISNDTVAGIVISKNNKALALLNQNKNCNYGVFIGATRAPGITHGIENSKNILVRFIPTWHNISIGDEVITNGLDNIFFEGLKVGRVVDIIEKRNHKEAIVKPYSDSSIKKYYYVYQKPTMMPSENQPLTK